MRKPRPEHYDPNYKTASPPGPDPEEINIDGVVAIKSRPTAAVTEEEAENVEDDTTVPRHHDTTESWFRDTIETVRQAVKEVGKEAATHRFTISEKRAVAQIIFTYQQEGVKTSENEITRIAINYLLEDHKINGENGILAQVLEKLNS